MATHNPPSATSKTPIVLGIVAAALVAIVVVAGGFLYAGLGRVVDAIPTVDDFAAAVAPEPFLEISPAIVTSVQEMAQLTTVEMTEYTIVEKGTDQGWLQWARGDTLRLMAVADIGAGVDLAAVGISDFSVSQQGVVEVNVPNAEIHYVAVDHEGTQILEREKGLFTKGDPQLESESREIAETVLVDSALQSGILTKAESSARIALTNLLMGLGYSDVIVSFG